ncbi:MAG TPA: phosphoadenylyl-sulfate reductase [Saprospiraceae bacterium]|nr:phosphoadenylyl-sulfate reductase [Saprospiraceae bacterium]
MALDLHTKEVATTNSTLINQVNELNEIFAPLDFRQRIEKLYDFFPKDEILLTSSFGGNSALILYIFSEINPEQKIHFIDTGYHFPETLAFKNQLQSALGMQVEDLHPDTADHAITTKEQWWIDKPNDCCQINKVNPLEQIMPNFRVWVSGVMAFQTPHRANLRVFEESGDIIKFHPIIDIDEYEAVKLTKDFDLPLHPLTLQGYGSIGCKYCTFKGVGREGRWIGSEKTECGLHTSLLIDPNKTSNK